MKKKKNKKFYGTKYTNKMAIVFNTEKRKIKDLIEYEYNPRFITRQQYQNLKSSIQKFGLAEIPCVNKNNIIIAGHQRIKILREMYSPDYEIDVRVPSKLLTEEEFQEYNIRSNKNTGQFDIDILANSFNLEELVHWGFTEKELHLDMINPDDLTDDFTLNSDDKSPFQQITFTLADKQMEYIKNKITEIKKTDDFKYCETFGNENSNGNALYLLVSKWVEQKR
tara:strand:- start:17 stop:688 length:672 start_codon:yes stop_codon:yes gene_type:complete